MLGMKNPHQDILVGNITKCAQLDLPFIRRNEFIGKNVVIVATGPSLSSPATIAKLKKYAKFPNNKIMALKEAIRFCHENGIRVDFSVSMDPGPRQATEIKTPRVAGVRYIVATSCHPDLFFHLREHDVELFHSSCGAEDKDNELTEVELYYKFWPEHLDIMGGGFTVLNRALIVTKYQGFNKKILIGADMGWRDGQDHYFDGAFGLNGNFSGPNIELPAGFVDSKSWWTKQDMLASAADIAMAMKDRSNHIEVEGDSLIKSLSRKSEQFLREVIHPEKRSKSHIVPYFPLAKSEVAA
jgi:hypothetical protein